MLPIMKTEASIMKMSRRVADTESSSNREVALLEELEDELVPKSCICLTIVLILGATLWTFGSRMASMAMECRRGMYCLMSFGSSVLPITYGLATYRFLGLVPDLKRREHEVTSAKWRKGAATFFFSLVII
ncbi:unnamed protein product [Triticum turgidum subsp. durum]|uniref:Uncharacterized protein n=1 Tax=Triticum turgidum subsp. durum TaxID=4567 RepID=A0A9R0SAE0_TRITD|nr:unnamed protein product [Triticum turgidum subsp. durum]